MNNEYIYLLPILQNLYNIEYIELIENIFAFKNKIILQYKNSNKIVRINSEWKGLHVFISKIEESCEDVISIDFTENFINVSFNITKIYDYSFLYNGEFSKLNELTKKTILNYYLKRNKLNSYKFLKGVLYKEKWLRDYLSKSLKYNIPIQYELDSKWEQNE